MPKKNLLHHHKKNLVDLSEISLSLDTYDDIFSDFDSRPYSQRALSDDFLIEAKKAARDKVSGNIELNFLIPKRKSDDAAESLIKKRLKEHFKKHHARIEREKKGIIKHGVYFILTGILIMVLTAFILFKYGERDFMTALLIIILEPAGWFLFWEGMHLIIFDSKSKTQDLDFYRKMATSEIKFIEY